MAENIPEGLISKTDFFDAKSPITKMIPAIQQSEAVVVNKNDDYFGIIDSRVLYRTLQNLRMSKKQSAERFVIRVPRITNSTSLDDVIYFFHKARSKALPYSKGGKITGVMLRSTMIKVLLSQDKLRGFSVGDAMVSPLISIDLKSTVTQAKEAMRANKINRLAVFEDDKFVGIVTNNDLIGKFATPQERLPQRKSYMYNPSNLPLSDVVVRNPRTMDYKRALADAAREMIENKISSVIIMRSDKPVGVVTELDILTSAMAKGGAEGNKIFLSGLDAETYQYEDEIRDMLKAFLTKIERMNNIKVDYISVVVKKFKTKSYEIYVRLSLGSNGIINSHTTGHIFERTMSDMLNVLERDTRKIKERYLTVRKVLHNAHPEETLE